MSKEKLKQNGNHVGANCIRPHFEGMAKKENGITLIALVITIIVMLILVGVSVTVALNGGLFTTAQQAKNKTQLELDKEQLTEMALGALDSNGIVDLKKLDAAVLADGKFTGTDGTYTSVKSGNTFTVSTYGSVTLVTENEGGSEEEPGGNTTGGEGTGGQKVTITPKKETYTIGDEVTIGEENFYVIADDTEKVTLLAKFCLDKSDLVQSDPADPDYDPYGGNPAFSSTNYWTSETSYPLNLNDYPVPEGVTSVIITAKEYGAKVGGTGRLMTYEEADELQTTNWSIVHSGICYWLGTAASADKAWCRETFVGDNLYECEYSYASTLGVRPVVEILKSNIS